MDNFWTKILLEAFEIIVLETNNIALLSQKNKSLAKDLLVQVQIKGEQKNSLALLLDALKDKHYHKAFTTDQLINIFEILFNMKEKAREIFQGYIFADICDSQYNLRGFRDLYVAFINFIDSDLGQLQPHTTILTRLNKSIEQQYHNNVEVMELFKNAFQLRNSGVKDIQKNSIQKIVKVYQTHYYIVASEILYLMENLGVKDIDKYMLQNSVKYNLEVDQKLHGKANLLQELKFENYNEEQDKNSLVFWISHFMNQKSASMDHFKLYLEEYCKVLVPINSSISIELSIEELFQPHQVNYYKDFKYLSQVIPPFQKESFGKLLGHHQPYTSTQEEDTDKLSGTESSKRSTEKQDSDSDTIELNPQFIHNVNNNQTQSFNGTESFKNSTFKSEVSMGYNFNNNNMVCNMSTIKTSIDGSEYHFTKRNTSKNNTYKLTISKGSATSTLKGQTMAQFSYKSEAEQEAQFKEELKTGDIVKIMDELSIDSDSDQIKHKQRIKVIATQLDKDPKGFILDTQFYINSSARCTSMIKFGSSQSLSDIVIPGDKRINPVQIGVQIDPTTNDLVIYDLSLDINNTKVKLQENQQAKIFDDCIVNFANIVKYRFNYKEDGTVLNISLVEVLPEGESIKSQLIESLSIGFTDKPIMIGRNKKCFLVINFKQLSREHCQIMFTPGQRYGAVFQHLSKTSATMIYLKGHSQIKSLQISDGRRINDLCGSNDSICIQFSRWELQLSQQS